MTEYEIVGRDIYKKFMSMLLVEGCFTLTRMVSYFALVVVAGVYMERADWYPWLAIGTFNILLVILSWISYRDRIEKMVGWDVGELAAAEGYTNAMFRTWWVLLLEMVFLAITLMMFIHPPMLPCASGTCISNSLAALIASLLIMSSNLYTAIVATRMSESSKASYQNEVATFNKREKQKCQSYCD